jgi:transaldolase
LRIQALAATGMIDGVTTNNLLVATSGGNFLDGVRQICAIVEGPASAEVEGLAQFKADWEKTGQRIL